MRKLFKKSLSVFLAILMILSIVPLTSIAEIADTLPIAKAVGVSSYNAYAAVEWAKQHVGESTSVLFGTRYWYDGGDCANFVSECIYMGGLDPNSSWNHNGYLAHFSTSSNGSWIRAQQLHDYAISIGGQEINNPSASQAEVGDLIFYKKTPTSRISHSAIVVNVGGGTLEIAYHSTNKDGQITPNWHLGFANNCTYLIKMHGAKCTDRKIRDFDVYTAGSNSYGYSSTSTNSSRVFAFLSGEYAHVYETKVSGGITWGKTFRYGAWGWVNLATMNYRNHYFSGPVNHTMGAWTVKTVANCKTDGLSERVCTRCGYTEQKTTKGGHVTDPKATCTTQGICKLCGAVTESALGHDWNDGTVTTAPTCTAAGVRTYVCNRNTSHTYTEEVAALGHDYEVAVDLPGCVTTGTTTYKCTRCGDSYVSDSEWSGYAAINTSDPKYAEFIGNSDLCKSRTEYRYRTKSTTTRENDTGTAPTVSGYTLENTTWRWNDYGAWSSWSDSAPNPGANDYRQVKTQEVVSYYDYKTYYHYYRYASVNADTTGDSSYMKYDNCIYYRELKLDYELSYGGQLNNNYIYKGWWYWKCNPYTSQEIVGTHYKTQYSYRDRTKHYTYTYYKWSDWSSWSTTARSANATTQVETRTTYSFKQSALNHNFVANNDRVYTKNNEQIAENEINTTCYKIGDRCSRCGTSAPNPHLFNHSFPDFNTQRDQYTIEKQTEAITVYKGVCRNGCECYILKTVDNHNIVKLETIDPTCDDEGYTVYGCTIHPGEAEEYKDDFVPALGDDYSHDIWGRTVEPTCTEPGLEICKCARYDACGHYITREVDPLGHSMTKFDEKAVTCTVDGNSEYYFCATCEKYFADEDGDTEIETDSWIIPATGHKGTDENGEDIWVTELESGCGVTGRECVYCVNEWCDETIECEKHEAGHGFLIKEREIEEIAPDYSIKVVITEPTCYRDGEERYYCSNCINTDHEHYDGPFPIDRPDHTWSEWKINEPICCYDGDQERYCIVCGEKEFEPLPAEFENHDFETVTNNSTCTENGTTYEQCTRCGYKKDEENIDPTGHDIILDESQSYPATCDEPGLNFYVCTRGDYEYEEKLSPIDHAYELAYHVPATCVKQGYDHYICQNDTSHTKDEIIDEESPLGHAYGPFVSNNDSTHTKECQRDICTPETTGHYVTADCYYTDDQGYTATCTETGLTDGKHCIVCDYKNPAQAEIGKLGHDFGEWYVTTKATCTENGTLKRDCSRGDETESGVITAREHNFGEWYVVEAPTCTKEGLERRDCLNTEATDKYEACSHYETQPIIVNADAHDFGEWNEVTPADCTNKGLEKRVCKRDENHVETRETAIIPDAHNWDDGVITTAPTCKDEGVKTYTCKINSEHTYTETLAVDPDNHVDGTYVKDASDPTCTEKGYTGDTYCKGCDMKLEGGEEAEALGHDMGDNWYTHKEPTYDEQGEMRNYCQRNCGYYESQPIAKLLYKITFVVKDDSGNETVVKTVEYEKGAENISAPSVPSKEGFAGYWEDYELNAAPEMTVKAYYEPISKDNVSELETDKTADYDENTGVANITLSAFANTLNVKSSLLVGKPLDIILVVDQSGSMEYKMDKDEKATNAADSRREKLKSTAKDFVNSVYDNAVETGADHRISVVGFAGAAYSNAEYNYVNTGILTPNGTLIPYYNSSTKKTNAITSVQYAASLMNVLDSKNTIIKAVNAIASKGATAADLGLKMAENVFANNEISTAERQRVVIFLTDGSPTYGSTFENDVANNAISYANELKNLYSATVYTVGIIDETKIDNSMKNFMQFVSSNYPNATALTSGGSGNTNAGYYVNTTDSDKLKEIFADIFVRSVEKNVAFSSVTFHDTISEYFTLTTEQEEELRSSLLKQYGIGNENIIVTRNADGTTTLDISGINPKKVYDASGTLTGYRAEVNFNVSANEKALKAGIYNTNTDDAYFESEGEKAAVFETPKITVNSDRNIIVFNVDGLPYAITQTNIGDKVVAPEVEYASWNIDENTVVTKNYTVFNAELESTDRVIIWKIDGEEIIQTYKVGQIIIPPTVESSEEMPFICWDSNVPFRMPDVSRLVFNAVFKEHVHTYNKLVSKSGNCETRITTVYACDCGDTKETVVEPSEHSLSLIASVNNSERYYLVCNVCGKASGEEIYAKKSTGSGWNKQSTVIDLTEYLNGAEIQPNSNGISIKLYVGDKYSNNTSLTVYVVNESGKETNSTVKVTNGYITFTASHFSYYVLTPNDSNGNPVEEIGYVEIYCSDNGHTYIHNTTPPTCTTDGYTTHTCSVCGDSYTDTVTSKTGHYDDDGDGYCDKCHTNLGTHEPDDPSANCSCNCHKKGIVNFFWKIINFFHKLFKMEKYHYCDCGKPHW